MNSLLPDDQLQELIDSACCGTASAEQLHTLNTILARDERARELYVDYFELHTELYWLIERSHCAGTARQWDEIPSVPAIVVKQEQEIDQQSRPESKTILGSGVGASSSSGSTFLPIILHAPLSYLPESWPVAYSIATVICGIGALIAGFTYVSHPTSVARQSDSLPSPLPPLPSVVGRITGIVDCLWVTGTGGAGRGTGYPQPLVSLGQKINLRSGLMEITYDTGAKIILQGPVRYEVDSKDGGYLSVGKLTASVEKRAEGGGRKAEGGGWRAEDRNLPSPSGRGAGGEGRWTRDSSAQTQSALTLALSRKERGPNSNPSSLSTIHYPLFTIKTPTAVVTDLGTEFGVEVDRRGHTKSHVFRGSVKVELANADSDKEHGSVILHESESIETAQAVDLSSSVELRPASLEPDAFVRRIAPVIRQLDLRDILVGGAGRSRYRARGIGDVEEVVLAVRNDRPLRLDWTDMVDRIFGINGDRQADRLDSAGHVFDGFPATNHQSLGSIWATATRNSSEPLRIGEEITGGLSPFSSDENGTVPFRSAGLLGIRPNAGITFDLQAIRRKHVGMRPSSFHATVFCGSPAPNMPLFQDDFQSDTSGTMPSDMEKILMPEIGGHDIGGRWACGLDNSTLIQVWNNADPAKPGGAGENRYVKIQRDAATHDGDLWAKGWKLADTAGKRVELRFSIFKESDSPTVAALDAFTDESFGGCTFTAYFQPDGTVWYFDGQHAIDTGITYQRDTWQDVTIRADMATQTFSISVEGATADNLRWSSNTDAVSHLYFTNGVAPAGRFFIDNVTFTASCGLSDSQKRGFGSAGHGDFWVFIDGQLKQHRTRLLPEDGTIALDMEIQPDDRFLTLVSTGGDGIYPSWIVWANPKLEIVPWHGEPD